MTNKFRIGEIVLVNGKGKIEQEKVRTLGIVEEKDYFFNEYLISLVFNNKKDWFKEKDIERVMDRKFKKQEKYKVALAIDKRGLDRINYKLSKMPNKNNNILKKVNVYDEYKVFRRNYAVLIWTSTYWSETNYVVNCIEETLAELRENDIAYKQIIIGETDPTYIKINEFIENDPNVDIFNIFQKIEIKNNGGILV